MHKETSMSTTSIGSDCSNESSLQGVSSSTENDNCEGKPRDHFKYCLQYWNETVNCSEWQCFGDC